MGFSGVITLLIGVLFIPFITILFKANLVERKEDSDTSTLKPQGKKQRIFVVFVVRRWEDFNGSITPLGITLLIKKHLGRFPLDLKGCLVGG